MTSRQPSSLRLGLAALLIAGFVLACIRFALVQDIWIDETTQLSGVTLGLGDLLGWLGGSHSNRFGLPGDRMPPLAYLLDHLWWEAAGAGLLQFRLFHVALATGGLILVARTELTALGRRWLGVGLAFLVLSPKLIETAVELRSYPLFFAVTCALIAWFLEIVQHRALPPWRKLLEFGAGCVVLSYIHFFGVVAAFSFFATLILACCRNRAALLRVVIVGAGLALSLLGLSPFIFGATANSSPGSAATSALTGFVPLLLGHSALLIYPVAALLYFVAAGVLLLAAAAGAARRARQQRLEPLDWLLVVAAIGCVATILPSFVISTFSALKPSYSIWLLPVFALLIAQGASQPFGVPAWDRVGRIAATVALLIGAAIGTGVFLAEAPWFVHGPHRTIAAAQAVSPPVTAIVYGEPGTFAYGYFPMVYQSNGNLPQWLAGSGGVARLGRDGAAPALPLAALGSYKGLIVVDIHPRRYGDLRDCLHNRCPAFGALPLVDGLVRSGQWLVAGQRREFGFYDAMVTRLTPVSAHRRAS